MATIYSLPGELIGEIATHIAQQSGLDLLAFSRTSSSLRKAARRAGLMDLEKYAIVPDAGAGLHNSGESEIAPVLQSCIQPLPKLEFPVFKWAAEPLRDERKRGILLEALGATERDGSPLETKSSFEGSLFLRSIHKKSVRLWDLSDYPPRICTLNFAKQITRAPDTKGCGGFDPKWDEPSESVTPGVRLKTISIDEVRVVLAQTTVECTFHLIDAYGQPYLAWRMRVPSPMKAAPMPEAKIDPPESSNAAKKPSDADKGLKATPGCGSDCGGFCKKLAWCSYHESNWKAARLPRRQEGDKDPGVFFYNLPLGSSRMQWALILTRPDRSSSETMSSGQLDLAWTASTSSSTHTFHGFSLEVLGLGGNGTDHIVQIHWREATTKTSSGSNDSPAEADVRVMHLPLHLVSLLSRKSNDARSKVANTLVKTSLDISGLPTLRDRFRLSNDALKLFVLLPAASDRKAAMLTVHERASTSENWRTDMTVERQAQGHDRILGVVDDWLVMADDRKVSVQILRMTSPLPETLQIFDVRSNHPDLAASLAQAEQQEDKAERSAISFTLLAGRVLLTSRRVVKAIIELSSEEGPYMVDLPRLIGMCVSVPQSVCEDTVLPRMRSASTPEPGQPKQTAAVRIHKRAVISDDSSDGQTDNSSNVEDEAETGSNATSGETSQGEDSEDEDSWYLDQPTESFPGPHAVRGAMIFLEEPRAHWSDYLRLPRNDTERPIAHADPRATRPLVLVVRSDDLDPMDVEMDGEPETWYTTTWMYHAILLRPRCSGVKIAFCAHGFQDEMDFEPTGDYAMRACADGQILLDFYERDDDEYEDFFMDRLAYRTLIDFSNAEPNLTFPSTQVAVMMGRWSNFYAPSLLFRACDASAQSQLRFFRVGIEEAIDKSSPETGQTRLYAHIARTIKDEIKDRGREDAFIEWGKDRPLPNWFRGKSGAVFIGGVKRLLAFLTAPEAASA